MRAGHRAVAGLGVRAGRSVSPPTAAGSFLVVDSGWATLQLSR